jgi:3-oxoacyl-[acyl-carrier protein] reductase
MDLRLTGRRTVVTGSGAGIGEAIARRLAAVGAAVVVHGRRPDATGAAAAAINADAGDARDLVADLADPAGCARLISGPLAGYINGANLRIDGGSTAVV